MDGLLRRVPHEEPENGGCDILCGMEGEKISVEELDARLIAATAKRREETLAREAKNREIAELLARKELIADRLESLWAELEQVNSALSALVPNATTSPIPAS